MPRTRECDYCGADIEPGTGTMFVHNDGSTVHYCSSKCENNADLGREARNLEWTASGRGTEGGPTEEEAPAVEETESEDADDEDAESEDAAPDLESAEEDLESDEETEDDEEAEEAEA